MMNDKVFSVYCITNSVNGKRYIGITSRAPESRWWDHKNEAKNGGGFALHQAIRKHGEINFKFEVICCTKNKYDLKELEIHLIEVYNTLCFTGHGYNMTKGGDNATSIGTCTARDAVTGQTIGRVDLKDPRWKTGLIVPATLGTRRSEKTKEALRQIAMNRTYGAASSNARMFKLVDPNGKEYVLSGIVQKFCSERNLKYSALYDYIDRCPVPPPSKTHIKTASDTRLNTVGWMLSRIPIGDLKCQA